MSAITALDTSLPQSQSQTQSPSTPPQESPTTNATTPPISTSSSPTLLSARRGAHSPMSLSFSSLPPLSQPHPPTNTLLITRLTSPLIFHPATLATIRAHLTSLAPLYSFSPLKSLSRIIVSFHSVADALTVRQAIDGTALLPDVVAKCYFGETTPINDERKYLEKPDAGRLFFISPPPSPPVGWEMRDEGAPNKVVHADDLAEQLAKLTGRMGRETNGDTETEMVTAEELLQRSKTGHGRDLSEVSPSSPQHKPGQSPIKSSPGMRSRSSTLIYDPVAHGDSPTLPAVMLETEDEVEEEEDYEGDVEMQENGVGGGKRMMTHTARPPVELMQDA